MSKAKRDLSTLNAAHNPDVIGPNRIRAALIQLAKDHGSQAYVYESVNPAGITDIEPLGKLADVGPAVLSRYRSQFAAHVVEVRQEFGSKRSPRVVWFAKPEAAKAAIASGAAKAVS